MFAFTRVRMGVQCITLELNFVPVDSFMNNL